MKLTVILIFFAILQVSAGSFAQQVSINVKDASIKEVLNQLTKQTGYNFICDAGIISGTSPITVKFKDTPIRKVLDAFLAQNVEMFFGDNSTIVLKKRAETTKSIALPIVITGTITDNKGIGLPGVSVTNVTKNKSVATRNDGTFTIEADKGEVIRFTMLGYQEKSIIVNENRKTISIVLEQADLKLSEVVVTALGIKREERSLGYAVSEVDGNDLKKARETNVVNSLAGKVPGLIINSTAGGAAGSSRVIIRGNTSITGNNQPLYVVDGIPIDNSNYGGTGGGQYASGYDFGDAISAINPDDIDKISVLKGPSASALYGTRAANGVILITTKKGNGSKELGIEVNSVATFETQLTKYDGQQYLYGQGANEIPNIVAEQAKITLFQNFGPRLDPDLKVISFDGVMRPFALVQDNISSFFKTGSTLTNTISLTNSNDVSAFRFSASNLSNSDIVPKSGMKRNTFNFNGSSKFGSKIRLEAKAFYMNEDVINRPALGDDPGNIGNSFIGLANNVDQATFANTYKDAEGNYLDWGGGQYRLNPYWVINEMRNETVKNRIMASAQLNYTILSWLNLQGRASTDMTQMDFDKFSPRTTPGALSGTLDQIRRKYSTTEADLLLTAQKQVTPLLSLSARLGASLSRIKTAGNNLKFTNMTVTDVISPSSFSDQSVVPTSYRKSLNSLYALLSAGYKSYLYFDATLRQDVSSTLPDNNNSYIYPSLSGSFVFSDAFKIDKKILSFGKFRASVAQVGGDTDPYLLDLYYNLNPLSFNGNSIGYLNSDLKPNKDLKPTRTSSYELGTELKFFNNRIGLDVSYYSQRSKDQINRVPTAPSSGFRNEIINAGVITNKGVEISLSAKAIVTKDFSWDLGVNFARNINNVESLAEGVPFLTLSDARWMGVSVVAKPGVAYGSILGFNYKKDPQGEIILDPTSLLPLQSDEREILGKGVYSWTGGFNTSFRYKNFTLSSIIDIKWGADLLSMTNYFGANRGSLRTTIAGREEWIQSEEERNAAGQTIEQWTAAGRVRGLVPQGVVQTGTNADGTPIFTPNTRAVDPSVYWVQILNDRGGVSVPYIYDASYIKMRELMLAYRLPASLTAKWRVKDVQIAMVSRNPFIIYKKTPNIDPDSNYSNGNGQGLEYGSLPGRRSFGFNLNFRF